MNVLHIVDSEGIYGAETIILNLMEAQKEMGIYPILLSIGKYSIGEKSIERELKKRGMSVISQRFRGGVNVFGAIKILNVAKSLHVDIIHSHGYKADILLSIMPHFLRKTPILTTLHGFTSINKMSKMALYEIFDCISLKRIDKIVAVSSKIAERKIFHTLGIKPSVIHNGIKAIDFEDGAFNSAFPEIDKKLQGKFKIISIGRLSLEKNFCSLIRAITHLLDQNVDASLVIFGEGNERQRLENCIHTLGLKEAVYMLGYYPKAYRFLVDFDVFALSSLTEGFPVVVIEAMQSETPIVATNVGEIPRMLDYGELGNVVNANEPEMLADALKWICRNEEQAKEKARKARCKALTDYSAMKMALRYAEVYKNIHCETNYKVVS